MAVLPLLKELGKGITFGNKATLTDGTQVLSPKATVVRSGDRITKSDGSALAPGTYQSDKYKTTYNPLGTFTIGNNGLVGKVNVELPKTEVVEPPAIETTTETKPTLETAVITPSDDLTIKPLEDAEKPKEPAIVSTEAKEDPKSDTEVIAEVKPEVTNG